MNGTTSMVARFARKQRPATPHVRQGVALLLTLFVLAIISVWTVHMLDSATVYQSALRNIIEYEQALYLANAGVHHAVAELENDIAWRAENETPGSDVPYGSYSYTAVDGAAAGTVEVTATGIAGGVTRRVQAIVAVE